MRVPTVDADRIARDVVRSGEPACEAIRARFGPDVFTSDGQLDRPRLASRVFADPAARTDLEAIVHPHVRRAIDLWFQRGRVRRRRTLRRGRHPALVRNEPRGGFRPRDRHRMRSGHAASPSDGAGRIVQGGTPWRRVAAQLPTAHKVARADFVVQTGGPRRRRPTARWTPSAGRWVASVLGSNPLEAILGGFDRVRQQHRDRQRPYPPWDRCQRTRDGGNCRMHITGHDRPALVEGRQLLGAGPEQALAPEHGRRGDSSRHRPPSRPASRRPGSRTPPDRWRRRECQPTRRRLADRRFSSGRS